jgi:hypothetical protein
MRKDGMEEMWPGAPVPILHLALLIPPQARSHAPRYPAGNKGLVSRMPLAAQNT